jgi:hypothetical protein
MLKSSCCLVVGVIFRADLHYLPAKRDDALFSNSIIIGRGWLLCAGVIFEQISIIYQLPRLFVGSFTLVLPYFPTGTAERVSRRPGHQGCVSVVDCLQ